MRLMDLRRPEAPFRLHKSKDSHPDVAIVDVAVFLTLIQTNEVVFGAYQNSITSGDRLNPLDVESGCLRSSTIADDIHCLVLCTAGKGDRHNKERQVVYSLSSGQHQRRALGLDLTVPLFGVIYERSRVLLYAAVWHDDIVCRLCLLLF